MAGVYNHKSMTLKSPQVHGDNSNGGRITLGLNYPTEGINGDLHRGEVSGQGSLLGQVFPRPRFLLRLLPGLSPWPG